MPRVSLSTARGFARWEKSILNHSKCHTITYPLHVRGRPVPIPTRPAKPQGLTLQRNARGVYGTIALRAHRVSFSMPGAYISHQRGAMMLLQLRGPDACVSPLRHSLLLSLRTQTVSPFPSPK